MEKDRVLAEIREAIELNRTVKQKNNDALSHAEYLLKNEDEYNRGLNDAWELAKRIALSTNMVETAQIFIAKNICGIEQHRLFGDCFALTPQEALAKLESYKKSKDEIKVGDVVRFKANPKTEVLITSAYGTFDGIHLQTDECGKRGEVHSGIYKLSIEKTGKHIDIESLLAEIGRE